MFIYLLLKYDDIAYAELFISEDITNWLYSNFT